jgi:phosphoglycolate phosphatase
LNYRLAIFDLDGTLADAFPWFVGALDRASERFGFRRPDAAEREALRHCGSREILRRLQVPLWKVPAIARHMRSEKAAAGAEITLFPGAGPMLRRLSEGGITLAMVSSDSEANVRATLGAANAALVGHYACEASLFGKAAHLRSVLRLSGIPAREAIYIGDELRDAEAARRVGMAFGAVAWGFAAPDALRAERPEAMFHEPAEIALLLAGTAADRSEPPITA